MIYTDLTINNFFPSVNTAPTLTATGIGTAFIEGEGGGIDVFAGVTADTGDGSETFTGATLTVTGVTDTTEYLIIAGTQVALTDATSGTITGVGSYAVSMAGGTATVTLSGMTASNDQMGGLIDGIQYFNSDASVTAGNRVVTLTGITDSGASSNSAVLNIAATVVVVDVSNATLVVNVGTDSDSIGSSLANDLTDNGGLTLREAMHWADFTGGADFIELRTNVTLNAANFDLPFIRGYTLIKGNGFKIDGAAYAGFSMGEQSGSRMVLEDIELTNFSDDNNFFAGAAFLSLNAPGTLSAAIRDVSFYGNNSTGGIGGGVVSVSADTANTLILVDIQNSRFLNNDVSNNKGVIAVNSMNAGTAVVNVTSSAIYDNSGPAAIDAYTLGAGNSIYMNVSNSSVAGNVVGVNLDPAGGTISVNILNSIVVDNTTANIVGSTNSQSSLTTNSSVNFVNSGSGDYRLAAAASNALNVGDAHYLTGSLDVRGLQRVRNGAVDIGAYESWLNGAAPSVDVNGSTGGVNYTNPASSGYTTGITVVDSAATVTQSDSETRIWKMSAALTGNVDGTSGADETLFLSDANLLAAQQSGIAVTGNNTATLTLIGGDTLADFQAVLRNIQYKNVDSTPTTGARTVTITVDDDATASATATITVTTAVAPTVALSINNATVAEAAGSSTITATLSATASTDTTITLTPSGTATGSGTDYTLSSTTITITAGNTTGTATLSAVQDALDEDDETVILDITGVSGGGGATESGSQQQTITITDDDPTPSLSIADVSQAEGNSDTYMTFTVTLSAASGKTVTVNYATSDGTATVGDDYAGVSDIPLSFAAGETSKTFDVLIGGDTTTEADETFTVTLSNPSNATISDATATGTITNDDIPNAAPTDISLSNATLSVYDGSNATVGTLTSTDANGGDTHTYTLVSGTGDTHNASFNISGDSLRANDASALTAGSYSVRIRSTDSGAGHLTYAKAFTITVTDTLIVTVAAIDASAPAGSYAADLADGGGLDLREALALAGGGGKTIGFDAGLSGQTITLGGGYAVAAGTTFDADTVGTLTITGQTLSLAGAFSVTNGTGDTLTINSHLADNGSDTSALTKNGAGTLVLGGTNNTSSTGLNTIMASAGRLQISAATNLGTDGVTLSGGVTFATAGNTLTATNTFAIDTGGAFFNQTGGGHLTLSNQVSGDGLLTKTGGGSMTLSGNNDALAGGVTINNGTVNATSTVESLGYGSVTLGGGMLVLTDAGTIANDITVSGAATISNSDAVTLSGVISGSGILTKTGAGNLTLAGANTYSGGTTVSSGTLIGTSTSLQGAMTNNATVEFAQAADGTYSGIMSGTGGLTKTGAGTLTLSGANTYTGATTVSAGTLLIQGSLAGSVAATAGTRLGATGGVGTTGSVATGALTIAAGGTLAAEINGTTAGTGYDQMNVTGAVNVSGATLALTLGFTPAAGNSFILINNDSTDAMTGAFSTVTVGGTPVTVTSNRFTTGGLIYEISTSGGTDSNDLTLTVVDTTAPTVQSVAAPANATYKIGDTLDFIVTFSEAVTISGTPSIALTLDTGGTVQANLNGTVTNSTTGTFRHTVIAGNLDLNGIGVATAITPNSATIRDAASNAMTNFAFTPPTTTGVLVDGVRPDKAAVNPITASDTDNDGTYDASETLTLTFTEAVDATHVIVGNLTVSNGHSLGTGAGLTPNTGHAASFTLTLGTGPTLAVGDTLTLTAANVVDQAGNQASGDVVFTVPTLNAAPVASAVTLTGTAAAGQTLTGTYTFTDANSDAENTGGGGSSYRLVRSADNDVATTGDNTDAVTATATGGAPGSDTYVPVAADIGQYLFYCVTPAASAGTSPGSEVCSSAVGPVCLSATATVTSSADSGAGSLRQALVEVCGGGAIGFDATTFAAPQTITLASELTVGKHVTVNGGTARNVTVSGNNAVRVFHVNDGANLTLNDLSVVNGRVTATGGGGIDNGTGSLTLNRVSLADNVATGVNGGALYQAPGGSATLNECLVRGNSTTASGGALFNDGTLSLRNTTVTSNHSDTNGGGLFNNLNATATVTNGTFQGNTATTAGGALFNHGSNASSNLTLKNTLLAGNTATNGTNCSGTVGNDGHNLDDGTSCAFGSANGSLSSTNPSLGTFDTTTGTFPLLAASPAIDAGTNTGCPTTDQRGIARPQGTSCDIGAYEEASPINGSCGTANQPAISAPTTNLCAAGRASPVSGSGPWAWSCQGLAGGTTASCAAPLRTWTATASVNGTGGSISPASQSVSHNARASFAVTPATGYGIASVSGCGGSLSGSLYTTGPITDNTCTVSASFSQNAVAGVCGSDHGKALSSTPTNLCATGSASGVSGTGPWTWTCAGTGGGAPANCAATTFHTVTATAGADGSISPTSRTVNDGGVTSFTVTPDNGFAIGTVSSDTCGGSLNGNLYTTGTVNAACTVTASFTATNTSTTIISVNPTPSKIGQPVTVSYSVSTPGAASDSVTVTAQDGTTCSGTAGGGSCTLTFNSAGTKTLIASYTGTAGKQNSASSGTNHLVADAPSLATPSLNSGVVGVPYAMQLVASGGHVTTATPYRFNATGLPAGFSLSTTGLLSGTGNTAATSSVVITVTDALNQTSPPQTLPLSLVNQLTVATTSLPAGLANARYEQTLEAVGGQTPYAWSLFSGSLPAGLTLDAATGELSGTPTDLGASAPFTIRVTDAANRTADQALTLTTTAPTVVETKNGSEVAANLTPEQGGNTCMLDDQQTLILNLGDSGAPAAPPTGTTLPYGLFKLTVQGCTPGQTRLTVRLVYPAALPAGTRYWKYGKTADNSADHWYVLPTAVIEGNTVSFTITDGGLGDDDLSANGSITDPGGPGGPVLGIGGAPGNGQVGSAYSAALSATSGTGPYNWSLAAGGLPPGVTLNPVTGALSGTPTLAGIFTFSVQLVDTGNGNTTVTQPYSVTIAAAGGGGPSPVNGTCGSAHNGLFYDLPTGALCASGTASAVSGSGPWTWSCLGSNGGSAASCRANRATATTYTVTTSASAGGTINPPSQVVNQGATATFTLTPATGYALSSVSGCGGTLHGTTYTTGVITGACIVSATFSPRQYTVTASAGPGGTIAPASRRVSHGLTASFTLTPADGYAIDQVSGCGGRLSGTTYTTAPVTAACTVTARFAVTSTWLGLVGDWDGDGTVTAGLYDPVSGRFALRNANRTGPADSVFRYGPMNAGWWPLAGDWDGDGVTTVGLYDPLSGTFYLRNAHTPGVADVTFRYGPKNAGWYPLAGDWNHDGIDTVGLYDPRTGIFFLRNTHTPGVADQHFRYGPLDPGWIPLVGDWNGDGTTTIGLYDGLAGLVYLRQTNTPGVANVIFRYGPVDNDWWPLGGDWNGDDTDTIGLFKPATGTFYLRDSNTAGMAEYPDENGFRITTPSAATP
ncbi:choice-of-anchor U domain-containing protein [Thiobaca trueperi]|uniref:choice-of-anchor U domain-containing protein n=1 Tax=Thiobaca trueperi TaxID=127458 RepID=UPI0024364788|nr:choice-of-anchor U domain-containing protein [Thiobaca trueperi]